MNVNKDDKPLKFSSIWIANHTAGLNPTTSSHYAFSLPLLSVLLPVVLIHRQWTATAEHTTEKIKQTLG